MTNIKPVNFKPSSIDQALINRLVETGQFKNTSDLFRNALLQLSIKTLEPEQYSRAIIQAYENDISSL